MSELDETVLIHDEGLKLKPYADSCGFLSIGVGRLLDARRGGGITRDEALMLLRNDISRVRMSLDSLIPWWKALDEPRQTVLLSMAFQLGVSGLMGFHNTLSAVKDQRWDDAAAGMLSSRWAQQVPDRAHRLAQVMKTGDQTFFTL